MKILKISIILLLLTLISNSCFGDNREISEVSKANTAQQKIIFGADGNRFPFNYIENGQLTGYDIDLGTLIADKLKKHVVFENLGGLNVLPALDAGIAEAAMGYVSTKNRETHYDFSHSYGAYVFVMTYMIHSPITNKSQLINKKIASSIGFDKDWVRRNFSPAEIIFFDTNNGAIEALETGHVNGVIININSAYPFIKGNDNLSYSICKVEPVEYRIIFKKNSPLVKQVNAALKELQQDGELQKLEDKWLKIDVAGARADTGE